MTNGERLLDTNIVVALFRNDELVAERIAAVSAVFLPTIVLGELYYGVRASQHADANLAQLDRFAVGVTALSVSRATAVRYGVIKGELRTAGRPIPDNDLWIAACAIEHELTLVTRDGHFDAVEGLQCERW